MTSQPVESAAASAWRINQRVTTFLLEQLPPELWSQPVPGVPRRTVRMLAAHLHNSRCMWIKMLGAEHGIKAPRAVNVRNVELPVLIAALEESSQGMLALIALGEARGGKMPSASWQNFPPELTHFVCYFVSHESYHRGQIVLAARQLGHRLSDDVRNGLWHWKTRAREVGIRPARRTAKS